MVRRSLKARIWQGALVAALLTGCNGGNIPTAASTTGGSLFTVTISNFAFNPPNLTVPAGATVTVVNADTAPHSVTSEATPGAFTPGAVNGVQFDTGVFNGTRTFTLPSTAQSGTVIPYYCTVHKGMMKGPGQVTVGEVTPAGSPQPPKY